MLSVPRSTIVPMRLGVSPRDAPQAPCASSACGTFEPSHPTSPLVRTSTYRRQTDREPESTRLTPLRHSLSQGETGSCGRIKAAILCMVEFAWNSPRLDTPPAAADPYCGARCAGAVGMDIAKWLRTL